MDTALKSISKGLRIFFAAAALVAATIGAYAYEASHYSAESVLAHGHWVKIKVDTTGIYQISYGQLEQWGFSRPENVRVYGLGPADQIRQQFESTCGDDLRPALTLHRPGKLLFYGEAPASISLTGTTTVTLQENYYDLRSCYFLHQEENRVSDESSPFAGNDSEPLVTAYGTFLNKLNAQNPLRGGAMYQGARLEGGRSQNLEFEYSGFPLDADGQPVGTGYVGYEYGAFRSAGTAEPRLVPLMSGDAVMVSRQSDEAIGSLTDGGTTAYLMAKGWRNFIPAGADGKISLSLAPSAPNLCRYLAVDFAYIIYPLALRLEHRKSLCANFLNLTGNQRIDIAGAPEGTEVWSIGIPWEQKRLAVSYDAATSVASVSSPRAYDSASPAKFMIFNPAAEFPEPEYVQTVANQNIHGMETPDMVIFTTSSFMAQARELASVHERLQGLKVAVIDQEEAFNEFSGGMHHPQGLRRLAKMFYDRSRADGSNRFRFLILYGASTFDNRFIGITPQELLVSFQAERRTDSSSSTSNYAGDQYFTFLEDDYNHSTIFTSRASIAGGRLPVRSIAQARQVNEKIERFLTSPNSPGAMERALFCSDNGDSDLHFVHNKVALDSIRAHKGITVTRIDNAAYPINSSQVAAEAKRALKQALMRGMSYWGYSGHAQHNSISLKFMWDLDAVAATTNADLPFAMLSTCDTYDFDISGGSILEAMVLKPRGGCIAGIGAGRAVMLSLNKTISVAVATVYGEAQPGMTYGQVFQNARNKLVRNNFNERPTTTPIAAGTNTLCYNFCGDPALPIPLADHKFDALTVNGMAAPAVYDGSDDTYPVVGVNVPFQLKARVLDVDGQPADFTGDAIIDVYEPRSRRNMPDMETVKDFTIIIEDEQLVSLPAKVENGILTASVSLPGTTRDGYNKLVVTAVGPDGHRAAGWCFLKMDHANEASLPAEAPVIEEFYLDTPEFTNGSVIGNSAVAYATVVPGAAGLSTSGLGVNMAPKCLLDGSESRSADMTAAYDSDGNYRLELPLADLSDGHHTLTLIVSSHNGQNATAELDFIVRSDCGPAALELAEDGVVRVSADFEAVHAYGEGAVRRLIVRDSHGATVFTAENPSFPYSWDLRGSDGNPVPDGLYRANILLKADSRHGHSEPIEFVVIKK